MVQFLIRLDDLCPTNNLPKWERFFELFDRYSIKPIIAVIPDNRDPKLKACGDNNPGYWTLVRKLQEKNYIIGMHGFQHLYQTGNSGLLKRNPRSEFAGLPLNIQEEKIKAASAIFKKQNVHTPVFVAPAHSFDRNTLLALSRCAEIKIISDGFLPSPYIKWGFKWIPAQLPEVTLKTRGTWTFNYHPETCTNEAFCRLEKFIEKHHGNFVSLPDLTYSIYSGRDYFKDYINIYKRLLHKQAKRHLATLKHLIGK